MKTPNEKAIKSLSRFDIPLEHLEEFIAVHCHIVETYPKKLQNFYANFVPAIVEQKTFYDIKERHEKLCRMKKGVTLERMILYYGEALGTEKFEQYRQKQANTNTFEYKHRVYGWSREQFDEYNSQRAVTRENLVKKYGEENGNLKFDQYCERQSYTKTLEYYIETYGEDLGSIRFKETCKKKGLTLENFIRLYGEELAEEKLVAVMQKTTNAFYQKSSQVFCWCLDHRFAEMQKSQMFQEKQQKEFTQYSIEESRCYKYDYVDLRNKIAIEYHGDHWHANPAIYSPSDCLKIRTVLQNVTAADVWCNDLQKQKHIENRGFLYICVWEQEWVSDRDVVLERIENAIRNHIRV